MIGSREDGDALMSEVSRDLSNYDLDTPFLRCALYVRGDGREADEKSTITESETLHTSMS